MLRTEVANIEGTVRYFADFGWGRGRSLEERGSCDLAGLTDPNAKATLLADMSAVARCSSAQVAKGLRNIVVATPVMAVGLRMCVFDRRNAFVRVSVSGHGNACDPGSDDDGVRWDLEIVPGVVPLPPRVPRLRLASVAFLSCSWSVYG